MSPLIVETLPLAPCTVKELSVTLAIQVPEGKTLRITVELVDQPNWSNDE
jgi:hypothetical protein